MTFLLPLILLSLCLFAVTAFAQEKSDFERQNLRGTVKKVEIYYLVPTGIDGKGPNKRQISKSMSFSRHGQTTEILDYSSVDDLPLKQVYIYNAKGRRILYENYGGSHRNELNNAWERSDEFVYKHDTAGRIIEQSEIYKPTKMVMRRVLLRYDHSGNVIEELHFGFRGEILTERKAYTFDSQGRVTSEAKFDRHGTLVLNTLFSYSANGLVGETTAEGKEMHGRTVTTYQYDNKNRLITLKAEHSYLSKNQSVGKTEFSYDDVRLTREERQYSGDVLMTKILYQLDNFGNILAKTETLTNEAKNQLAAIAKQPSAGLIPFEVGAMAALSGMFARERFSYEYDKQGNWTKCVEYQATEFVIGDDNLDAELKPVRTQIRTISYYD